jgi:hypothetical protein
MRQSANLPITSMIDDPSKSAAAPHFSLRRTRIAPDAHWKQRGAMRRCVMRDAVSQQS